MHTLPDSTAAKVAGIQALIALAQEMPRYREEAGLGPLPDNSVALDYEDRMDLLWERHLNPERSKIESESV